MKKTIKEELNILLPNSGIETIHGEYYMRFELGGEGNSNKEKIEQATKRGTEIFNQVIKEDEIIIVIEEWESEFFDPENRNKNYVFEILDGVDLKRVKGPFEQTYFEENEEGVKIEKIFEDKLECDLLIGKFNIKLNQAEAIIKGISSLEMGGEPCIPQNIYFFSIQKQSGFRIYDDRGCDVWANSLNTLEPIYENLNSWILEYNRAEIDDMFNNEISGGF